MGFPQATVLLQPGLGAELALTPRVGVGVRGGLHSVGEGVQLRDAIVEASWIPVVTDLVTVRLTAGASVPIGSVAAGSYFTPLSTGSVDPVLSAQVTGGGTWVAAVGGWARVPLYDGLDRRRQGPFLRGDLRGGRRIGASVAWVGLSPAFQLPSTPAGAAPDFGEVAATAGVLVAPWDRWSVGVNARTPLWTSDPGYRFAVGAQLRWVFGGGPKDDDDHQDEGGEGDHGEDDGHDHGEDEHSDDEQHTGGDGHDH